MCWSRGTARELRCVPVPASCSARADGRRSICTDLVLPSHRLSCSQLSCSRPVRAASRCLAQHQLRCLSTTRVCQVSPATCVTTPRSTCAYRSSPRRSRPACPLPAPSANVHSGRACTLHDDMNDPEYVVACGKRASANDYKIRSSTCSDAGNVRHTGASICASLLINTHSA